METPLLTATPAATAKLNKAPGIAVQEIVPEVSLLWVGRQHTSVPESMQQFHYYYAGNIEHAQQFVMHMLNSMRKAPSAIVFEFNRENESELLKWKNFFAANNILSAVPFFLMVERYSEQIGQYVAKYKFVDEVITQECRAEELAHKISFVTKFKKLNAGVKDDYFRRKALSIHRKLSRFSKRSLDVAVAGSALLLLSPVMLVIAALVKLTSKGPIFYAASRAGKNYHVFKFYKFRTMVVDADTQLQKLKHLNQYDADNQEGGVVFYKVSNDPRVTKLGAFLRNSSLDELPQLYNVLIGDMSLVGNRPLPLYESAVLTTDNFAERFLAPAGITGLWQISKRGKKDMSVQERIDLDISYAHKNSLRYDMWIMVNTPLALIQKDNV